MPLVTRRRLLSRRALLSDGGTAVAELRRPSPRAAVRRDCTHFASFVASFSARNYCRRVGRRNNAERLSRHLAVSAFDITPAPAISIAAEIAATAAFAGARPTLLHAASWRIAVRASGGGGRDHGRGMIGDR